MTRRALSFMELQRLHRKLAEQLPTAANGQEDPTGAAPTDSGDWHRAMATARQRFDEAGIEPDHETLEGAAWLQLQLEHGLFPRPGISEGAARRLLEAVYAGLLVAQINDHARVVLREPADTEAGQ